MEEHANLWRLLRRITEGESKKVVMSIKDEDGFRAWQRLKQRFEPGLAARQGIAMSEFSGMVARPAKSPGETVVLLTEMDRKMKLVKDMTGEEVSEMHARSALVGILDPVTRQHTAMNNSKSHEALKKIVQEFANNSTSQDAMHIDCADDSLAAMLSTPWIHNGTGPAKDAVTYPGTVPMARARAKARTTSARAHTNGARATKMGTREQQLRDVQGRWKGEHSELLWYQKGDGKSGGTGPRDGTCYTCGGNHFARDCPTVGGKSGIQGTGRGAWRTRLRPGKAIRTWERRSSRPSVKRAGS